MLLNLSAAQEKFYLQNNTYAGESDLTTAPPAGLGLQATTAGGYYDIEIEDGDTDGYNATATAAGRQTDDDHCAEFGIDQAGVRTATNNDCW
jgi:Tfp pilus assembly protein PilE